MKIGLVAPGGFDRSGTERVVPVLLWLVERLARRHEVHVYTLHQYPEPCDYTLLSANVHNIGNGRGVLKAPRLVWRTVRALQQEHTTGAPFHVLHGLWAGESGACAAIAGRLLRIPTVISPLGGELVALPDIAYGAQMHRRSRVWVTLALRWATAVVVASEFMRRAYITRRPDTERIVLGADSHRFTSAAPPPDPPWRLLHVASLNRVKDQPTLLRAMQRIHAAEPAAHLDILGEDTLHGAMQRLARDLGLTDAVTFHGFQPAAAVARYLAQAHLLLHSSRHEAGQMVVVEAAACGVPTVGTAVGHVADLAPDAAVAVPVGDDAALAAQTVALLRDPPRRQAIGRRAWDWAQAHDADWTAAQYDALYRRLAVEHHHRARRP